jgi:LuxR family maltose regulon positive regulatory protein
MVPRPALVARLTGARDAALALLVAPPGYGKSALLAEWARTDDRAFAWLGLDDDAALGVARRSALGGSAWADPERMAALAARTSRGAANAAGALLRTLHARHPGGFVLVIDDAQAFAPEVLRRVVEPMLRSLPDGCTIAVASRGEPALPVGRLRAHRAVVEIDTSDLAMTSAEAASLLRGVGVPVGFAEAQAVALRTEGWPVAVFLSHLADADHVLDTYVHEEVLSALTPSLTNFALRTAVLEELTGPSCDAVLKEPNSARKLARLARASGLLEPLDAEHETFRWHGLVRAALLAELRRVEPPLEARLHIRASDFYAREGNAERAIEHAVAARNVKRAGALLLDRLPALVGHGRTDQLTAWLAPFSGEAVAGSPDLAICAAVAALGQGDAVRAQHLALPAADSPALAAGIALIDAGVARGGAPAMAAAAERARASVSRASAWQPLLCFLHGTAAHLLSASEADALLEEGAQLGAIPAPAITALCLAQRTMLALERGAFQDADELADEALEVVLDHGLAFWPPSALVFAAAAAARARQGRADEAKHDLRQASELLTRLGECPSWYDAETRVLMAHASLWLADVTAARALLSEASRQARKVPGAVIFARWFDEAWEHLDSIAEQALAGPSTLTIAELRILRFLPSHRSFKEIAAQLGVSANTVKTQAHSVYRKLGVASRSEAVAWATETGLLGQ